MMMRLEIFAPSQGMAYAVENKIAERDKVEEPASILDFLN